MEDNHGHSHSHDHSHSHGHGHDHDHAHGHKSAADMHTHYAMPKTFEDVERWATKFETPDRDSYQRSDELLAGLPIRYDVAADIGSSTGFFSVRLAKRFSRVYAVDLEKQAAEYMRRRCAAEGITNVVPVEASTDGFALPERADLLLCCNVLHHIADPTAYFARVRRDCARAGAVLLLIDFKPGRQMNNGEEIGPKDEWNVKVTAAHAIAQMEAAGWRTLKQCVTAYHWNVFFTNP